MRNTVRMGTRIPVNLSLPEKLVDELDQVAGKRNRSAYVEGLLDKQLRRERMRRVWEAAAGSLSAVNYPHWATSELVQEWVRERRAEQTDPGAENADVPVARLDDSDRLPARSPGG